MFYTTSQSFEVYTNCPLRVINIPEAKVDRIMRKNKHPVHIKGTILYTGLLT